jgi:hypothetical protein
MIIRISDDGRDTRERLEADHLAHSKLILPPVDSLKPN